MTEWAEYYSEIPEAIESSNELKNKVSDLVKSRPIHGKKVEGGDREEKLKNILSGFFEGNYGFEQAYDKTYRELPERESTYAGNSQVFRSNWNESIVRMQVSRFYNQGVLHLLKERGEDECFVPYSPDQYPDSECTVKLAGGTAKVDVLLGRLERKYDEADYSTPVTIPSRPNCTHTVVPVDYVE
jgi:hypothetical protein